MTRCGPAPSRGTLISQHRCNRVVSRSDVKANPVTNSARSLSRRTTAAIFVLVLIAPLFGVLGFVAGASDTPTIGEAQVTTQSAHAKAAATSERASYVSSRLVAKSAGKKVGRARGVKEGTKRGRADGAKEKKRLADVAAAEAAEAAKPTTGYFGGCSEPLFVDGYCPTPDEIAAERWLEEYCGPFDPSRVQPDGSYLPKPGC